MLLAANDKDGGGLAGRSWHRPWHCTVPLATAGGQESLWTDVPTSVLQRGQSAATCTHTHADQGGGREPAGGLTPASGHCPAPKARARSMPGSPSTRSQDRGIPSTHREKPLPRSR